MNRAELIAALREGMYVTDGNGAKLILLYPSNPLMQAAADEIEAMEKELREILRSHAIISDRYMAMRDAESWGCYWD